MRPIQYLLIVAVLAGAGLYFWLLRSRGRDRLLAFAVGCMAIVFIVLPDWTSELARWVGVGRGTDLTTYVAMIAVGLALVVMQSRQRELQRQLTAVVRRQAIEQAMGPRSPEPTGSGPGSLGQSASVQADSEPASLARAL